MRITTLVLSLALMTSAVAAQSGAIATWLPLAEQETGAAQFELGMRYSNGDGVPEDHAEAVKWFRKAAEQGLATAQSNLGVMYANGEGVPEDDVAAYMWFNLAAAQGVDDARKNRDTVKKRMTREQIAEGRRLSREWKPKPDEALPFTPPTLPEFVPPPLPPAGEPGRP